MKDKIHKIVEVIASIMAATGALGGLVMLIMFLWEDDPTLSHLYSKISATGGIAFILGWAIAVVNGEIQEG